MAIDTIIKVSGTVLANATTNDIAAIDVPEDGQIMCIGGLILGIYTIDPAAVLDSQSVQIAAELSFLSTNQIGINDSRGAIAGIGASSFLGFAEVAATGGGGASFSEQNSLCIEGGIDVNAGERIHLHGYSSLALLTATATFILYMKTRGGGRRASKRR